MEKSQVIYQMASRVILRIKHTVTKQIIFTKGIGVSEFVTLLIKFIVILQNVLKYSQLKFYVCSWI